MDCDSCGRYRPSSEIAPLRVADGRFVLACARCRRLAASRYAPLRLADSSGARTPLAITTRD